MQTITLPTIPQTTISILKLLENHLYISNLIPATREDFISSDAYNKTGTRQVGYFFISLTEKKHLSDTLAIWITTHKDETFVSVQLNREENQLFKTA